MDRPVGPVDNLLRMSVPEYQVVADMTSVGGCGGVASTHAFGERAIADGSGKAASADALKLAVPAASLGNPDFDVDV